MSATRRHTLAGLFAALFGSAGFGASSADERPPAGRVTREEDFVDIALPIEEVHRDADGMASITARATIDNTSVGFAIDIYPEWKPISLDSGPVESLYWGKCALRSIGEESNRFVALLTRLYAVSLPAKPMLAEIEAKTVGLSGDPSQVMTTPVRMKLFFALDRDNGESEISIAVDLAAKTLQFDEKDPEYRVPLIQALTETD